MAYDLDLADRLRRWGLRVVEVAGWQTRGRSVPNFRGHVSHHTAGSPNGAAPSLNLVINGGSNTAPGPLANVLQSREPDGNDIIYVIAAGTANHAGSGGWSGLTGNSSVWGNEIEHTGVVPLPPHRTAIAQRVAAACVSGTSGADRTCQHYEWSSAGKIDVATGVDGNEWRRKVAELLQGGPSAPPQSSQPLQGGESMYIIKELLDGGGWNYYLVRGDGQAWKMSEPMAATYYLGGADPTKGEAPRGVPMIPMGALGLLSLGLAGTVKVNTNRVL